MSIDANTSKTESEINSNDSKEPNVNESMQTESLETIANQTMNTITNNTHLNSRPATRVRWNEKYQRYQKMCRLNKQMRRNNFSWRSRRSADCSAVRCFLSCLFIMNDDHNI